MNRAWLRAIDLVAALMLMPLWLPLLLFAAALVACRQGRPILFHATRMGRHGVPFTMWKIRSMRCDAESTGPAVAGAGDERITPVGGFLRRTKLDELPQFFHVLCGAMSIVGPRPESPSYLPYYSDAGHRSLRVKPGVTGPGAIYFFFNEDSAAAGDFEARYVHELLPAKLLLDDACAAELLATPLRTTMRFSLWTVAAVASRLLRRPCPGPLKRYFARVDGSRGSDSRSSTAESRASAAPVSAVHGR